MRLAYGLPVELERRRTVLGDAATGLDLVDEFFVLARVAVDGYPAPDSEEDVVRVEADSLPELHVITLKRQLTWFDGDNNPGFTYFYLDMAVERRHVDQPLNWFSINYGEGPVPDQDVDLDSAAQAVRDDDALQRFLARVPLSVTSWVDGDVLNDPNAGTGPP
jgi:hypothetical protein